MRWCQESESGCEEDKGEKPKKKKILKKKKGGKKKTPKPSAHQEKPASNNSACLYKPGEFREIRLKFIADLRKSDVAGSLPAMEHFGKTGEASGRHESWSAEEEKIYLGFSV